METKLERNTPQEIVRHHTILNRLIQLRIGKEQELAARPPHMAPDLTRKTIRLLDTMLFKMAQRADSIGTQYQTMRSLNEMKQHLSLFRERHYTAESPT